MLQVVGSTLVTVHTLQEREFIRQLANTSYHVWLGGYQEAQNHSWRWIDSSPYRISDWTIKREAKTEKPGVCMKMDPESGELYSALCEELQFYVCSINASSPAIPGRRMPDGDLKRSFSLFDVVWNQSNVAEVILRSSSFFNELKNGRPTELCYTSVTKHEVLYLDKVIITLEVLNSRLQEANDSVKSLLQDTLQHYKNITVRTKTSRPSGPTPGWLRDSLQSFHSVVLEDPIYWLVALWARASLHSLAREHLVPTSVNNTFYQEWREDSQKDVEWTQRFKSVLEKHQNKTHVQDAINIFREHMMNQKRFYMAVDCNP
ncbi:uncharacterized protein AKAME5_002682000 [Lates japonicus]|uniref:C-type lectin domain-containing protein n=1 Tax=Lates japonicus TaxID=270547 RepID=A0AAD3NQS8_LATJO|nr:uncharacterized protein AKAME5_002682000 [Lates japonicus]